MKERNHLSCCNHKIFALRIETVNLADGDYELIPSDPLAVPDVNLNYANLNQDLGVRITGVSDLRGGGGE